MPRVPGATVNPRASVIIPCRNDAPHLPLVLSALDAQTTPRDHYEVIVVDNGSRDASHAIARGWPGVIALVEPTPSAYVARNRGIDKAQGEYLLFLDADTVPCRDWLAAMLRAAQGSDLGLVGGRIESRVLRPSLGSRLLAWSRSAERRRAFVVEHGRLSGGNMLVARSLFRTFGPFEPGVSGGDGEFSERANPERKPVPYAADAVVEHRCDLSTLDYLRRAYRIARGQVLRAPDRYRAPPRTPWRPGFRRVGAVAAALSQADGLPIRRLGRVSLWAVLWLENWFHCAGVRAGRRGIRRRERKERPCGTRP